MISFLIILLPVWISSTLAGDQIHPEFSKTLQNVTTTLYTQLSKTASRNFLFSPFSLTDIMALVQSGAEGVTGEEIREAFHFRSEKYQVDQAFSHIKRDILYQKDYTLRSVNKIYVAKYLSLKDPFKKTAEAVYYTEVEKIDFGKKKSAADTINRWVEEKTDKKIRNFVEAGDLGCPVKTILINALHLKANWSTKFYYTFNQPFKLNDIDGIDAVETMYGIIPARYYHNQELKASFLELPLQGGEVTFTVALPDTLNGIDTLEGNIGQVLDVHNYPTNSTLVKVLLPRFKIETKMNLKDVLQKMGVKKIFTNSADLSGIGAGKIRVDKVQQKSFVDVDAYGVEAAAATSGALVEASGIESEYDEVFKADHPFIFYIKFKDFVMFAGRMADPLK